MSDALISGLLAGYGVALPVGAVAVLIVNIAARGPLTVAVAAALGVATADGIYALAAVLGGGAAARVLRPVVLPLRWCAAVTLVGFAVWIAGGAWRRWSRPASVPASADVRIMRPAPADGWTAVTAPRAYFGLLGVTLLNPATVAYFAAYVLGRQWNGRISVAVGMVFVCAVLIASSSWQLLLAVGGRALGARFLRRRGRLGTALVSSSLILVLALRLLLSA